MDRKEVLLRAAYEILRKCDSGTYVKNVFEQTAFYDGADCDGACLMMDIEDELDMKKP